MKVVRLTQLADPAGGDHFLTGLLPGKYIAGGGMKFKRPGQRAHPEGNHVHADMHEVFVILQGTGYVEVDGVNHPLRSGDVAIIDPGEEHYLGSSVDDPMLNLALHCGDQRHPDQRG